MANEEHSNELDRMFRKYNRFAAKPDSINSNKYFDVHPPVFWVAAVLAVIFIATTILVGGERMSEVFGSIQTSISDGAGWFFILAANFFMVFILIIGFSRFGSIRLGGNNARPEFSTGAWFSMLFSAGMGIGLIFYSVAEPMIHYLHPPSASGEGVDAAREAMKYTFLHWGLHAWAIYALVALSLAFFCYNRGLPLSIRSLFHPILGTRVYGTWGDLIDILAVLSTLFGLATSLGIGVQQINSGLGYLFGNEGGLTILGEGATIMEPTKLVEILLIAGITAIATISVVSGIDKGVKFLSEQNIRIGAILLVFMLIVGPTLFIFDSLTQNLGAYMTGLLQMGFWTESYQNTTWQNSWTVFYWSWWIAWSPFVGTFIARVSKGRTIKEFVFGVLLVPTLITFVWLSAFGGSAIYLEMFGDGGVAQQANDNVSTALFVLLEQFPLSTFTSALGVLLVASFFVTSSDSGSLVVDSLTSGGKIDAPIGQRVFWANTEGAVAAVLLYGGGLSALQTAVITTGLPFALILIVMCLSLYKGLEKEYAEEQEKANERERQSYYALLQNLVSKRRNQRVEKEKAQEEEKAREEEQAKEEQQ
jgi:choline/glycine/proline betaine transport protein